jgi:hypothetical protein
MNAVGNFWPSDCEGLCYPSPPGTTIDVTMGAIALARSNTAVDRCAVAVADLDNDAARLMEAISAAVLQLPPIDQAALFRSAAAAFDLDSHPTPPRHASALLARHIIRHPAVPKLVAVLPRRFFADCPLVHLPHVNAVLHETPRDITLAIVQADGATRFIWSDGMSISMPNDGSALPIMLSNDRLQILPSAMGLPILNGIADYEFEGIALGLADQGELSRHGAVLRDGISLLREVWPAAYSAAKRHLRGLVLLEQRGYARSHSPLMLGGVMFTTLDSPDRLADLICHEASHVRMNAMRRFDAIAKPKDIDAAAAGFRSPWRSDLRPLQGLVDGVHAFLNVCAFHRRFAEIFPGSSAEATYARQADNVRVAWQTLQRHALPTALGTQLFTLFEAEVARL